MTLAPAAQRVVMYLNNIIDINQARIDSGDLTPIDYRAHCKNNQSLRDVKANIISEFAKEDEE